MKKLLILGTLLFSTFVFADDVKQKEVIAQKLVSVDGTEQGLQNTDKMILEQIRMRLPKDIPENFYVDLIKNLNSEQRKQFIIQRYVETFSQKELQAALTFYQSTEGKAWAKKASEIGSEVAHFTTQNARTALNVTMQQHIDNPTVKQLMARMNPTPTPAQTTEKPETK
ncbi:DUF2059 domain-containing protein [Acinetobacter modestus]|uniref:DUF2059 domain-containing protein n=1 Tax=Acinetobacter modestus TaxID=1776740 RepID=N9LPF2_9GAMM|nr:MULTISPECIES: DUF2059 domain-containing protein [Acinetobacter]ENW98187.1 hypothetical protein F900_03661 [Acinetobacter modestus]KKW79200.1 hypothetical protein AAV96_08400 [Acinetobacter sp. AG1]MCH7386135.1 DUF2059 domain-containing protein [Acinetobacter modestus]